MAIQTSDLKLKVNDRTADAYLAAPQEASNAPGVLLLHAWWGLKPTFKRLSDRLAEQGFRVLAPDYYQGKVAQSIEEAEAMMKQRDSKWMNDAVKAAKDHLVSLRPGKPIGTVGFSMGAAYALDLAGNEPDIAATVMFYGVGEADYSKVSAKIQGHFSDSDDWEPLEGVRAMEAEMKAVGLNPTIHIYPKVAHWFVEEDRPEYDQKAADLAWQRTYEFLKQNLS